MDIGFGDVVTPCPISLDYPLLLANIPSIQIQAYSLETVIAEKFHTMIDRDVSNSRMKDFYDCHQLLTRHHIDDKVLYDAVCATLESGKSGAKFIGIVVGLSVMLAIVIMTINIVMARVDDRESQKEWEWRITWVPIVIIAMSMENLSMCGNR